MLVKSVRLQHQSKNQTKKNNSLNFIKIAALSFSTSSKNKLSPRFCKDKRHHTIQSQDIFYAEPYNFSMQLK